MKSKYQIFVEERWINCKAGAVEIRFGKEWLRYELKNGVTGLSRPDHWRLKP